MCDSKKASHPGFRAGVFFGAWPMGSGRAAIAYTRAMLWVKSLHIVFIASWFAGLFYLPRIFVNLAMVPADSVAERERLLLMAGKLLRFTTLLAVPALVFGLWLWLGYGIGRGPGNGWLHAKLAVVALIIGYNVACGVMLRRIRSLGPSHGHRWYRWFNEVPVLLLLAAVVLVVVKPF
jgi:protoporphyrinogen IX oxidase